MRWTCLAAALAACGGDLFHGTDWTTACDADATVKGCKTAGSGRASSTNDTSNGAGAASSSSGGGGAGGSAPDGTSAERAGLSCRGLLDGGYSKGNGIYWIDPGNGGPTQAFDVYCDMTSGWTLVAVV